MFKFRFRNKTRIFSLWSELWQPAETWLLSIEKNLISFRSRIKRGGDFDSWDIQVNNGLLAKSRGLLTIEEHGGGKQYLRFKCKTKITSLAFVLLITLACICLWTVLDHAYLVSGIIGFIWAVTLLRIFYEADSAVNSLFIAFMESDRKEDVEAVKLVIKEKSDPDIGKVSDAYHFKSKDFSKSDNGSFAEVE